MKRKLFSFVKNPKIILFCLIAISFAFIFIFSHDYGITWDLPIQDTYGQEIFNFYNTFGKDQSFLHLRDLRYYGPFFELIVATLQHIFNNHWYIRTISIAFTGVLGILAIGLVGFELKKPWVGVTAAISLALFPRYLGDSFINSKDIPFAVAMTFVLLFTIKLINNWNKSYIKYSIFLAISLGIALSIRSVAINDYLLLFLIAITVLTAKFPKLKEQKLLKNELLKYLIASSIIVILSLGLMTISWPYVLLNPFHNFKESIIIMSHFPWNNPVLFLGKQTLAINLPFYYSIVWLLICIPIIYLIFIFSGILILWKKMISRSREDYIMLIPLAFSIIPLTNIILIHSILYDDIRQYFFIIPPLFLVGAYGFIEIIKLLINKNKIILISIIIITGIWMINIIYIMVQLHPYEYIYFNEFVGGLPGANGKFDTDYFGQCYKDSAIWLKANYKQYGFKNPITFLSRSDKKQILLYLQSFKINTKYPDFYISYTRFNFNNSFNSYKVIHVVRRMNVPLCIIKAHI